MSLNLYPRQARTTQLHHSMTFDPIFPEPVFPKWFILEGYLVLRRTADGIRRGLSVSSNATFVDLLYLACDPIFRADIVGRARS